MTKIFVPTIRAFSAILLIAGIAKVHAEKQDAPRLEQLCAVQNPTTETTSPKDLGTHQYYKSKTELIDSETDASALPFFDETTPAKQRSDRPTQTAERTACLTHPAKGATHATPSDVPDRQSDASHTLTDTCKAIQFKIAYRVNKSHLDEDYMYNRELLDFIRDQLRNSPRVDSIVISSYASPEGPFRINQRLAKERAETAKQFIMSCMTNDNALSKAKIIFNPTPENWAGLRRLVKKRYAISDRDQLLAIIDSNKPSDEKKRQIRRLGTASWRFVIDSLMPELRLAEWVCYYEPIPVRKIDVAPRMTYARAEQKQPAEGFTPQFAPKECKPFVFALKTNLLYDAVTWLNFGIEVPFAGDKFSIVYDHQFPWWRGGEGNNHFCMRYLQMGGEFRWWFHPRTKPSTRHQIVRKQLSGHFLGAYGMGGKWDFNNGRKICYQGEFWSAGLSYGYAMPIGRRLNLEFSLSVGYASIPYRHFIPSEDYEILFRDPNDAGTWGYFGVTKVGVSLVVPINIYKKGGHK